MALRERNDCTDEGLVPRALAIHSSLLSSSTQRRMSSMNFLSDTLLFIATCATARYFWLKTRGRHAVGPPLARCAGRPKSVRSVYGVPVYSQGDFPLPRRRRGRGVLPLPYQRRSALLPTMGNSPFRLGGPSRK